MMLEKSNAFEILTAKGADFIYPLKMGGVIDERVFSELLLISEELTRLYKDDDLIPKKLLSELYLISIGIECENYHFKKEILSTMSESIMRCFNMLIAGESADDEEIKVPRIL